MDVSQDDKVATEMPEGYRSNENVSEEGDRSSEEKEEDYPSRNEDDVKKAGAGGDTALADKGAQGGDKGHKAGCEGDAATLGPVQSNETAGAESAPLSETTEELFLQSVILQLKSLPQTADEEVLSRNASGKPAAETLTVAGPAAGGDIDAATDAIKTQQEDGDGKRTSKEELTKETAVAGSAPLSETTDEEMTDAPGKGATDGTRTSREELTKETTDVENTGAPGKGATEAPVNPQPHAEGDTGVRGALTPHIEEKDVQSTKTTDVENTGAPGEGATEAPAVSQHHTEGDTGVAGAVTPHMEEKDVQSTKTTEEENTGAPGEGAAEAPAVSQRDTDIDAATDAIKTQQEDGDEKRTSKEELTKETTHEEMTGAPGEGATEASAVPQPHAEGDTGVAGAVTPQMEEQDVQSTTEVLTVDVPEAGGDNDAAIKTQQEGGDGKRTSKEDLTKEEENTGAPGEGATEAPAVSQHHTEGDTGVVPPSATKSKLHFPVVLVIGAVFILVLALLVVQWQPTAEQKRPNLNLLEVLREELVKVEQSFRSQRPEVWRRSRIHLQRHLKSAPPSEPVSLILVGGHRAEKTLGCLAARLAKAFSLALNGSVLQVDGASLANMDHDQVKLDLDNQLREAFEGDKQAAVIHRLEELPPSSTLIFYRYCDHENAAFKHPLLAFTVLLPQAAVGPEFSISQVEELVHSHIHLKFLTSDQPDTFDRMDVDKLSGLWSRISHLILPVNMEEHMERGGC